MTSTIEISPGITTPIADKFKGVLLDAYGVFWGGNDSGLLPGAAEIMEKLVGAGKIVGVLSNTTQMASKEISKLHKHGIVHGKHFHFFVSSGEVARDVFLNRKLPFETPRNRFYLFGGAHPRFSSHETIFQGSSYKETSNIDEADFLYLSIPHINGIDQTDPELFREEVHKIIGKKLPMVCSNPDRFAHEGNPPVAVVRQGSIAAIYEEIGGQVFYIGKPHPMAYTMALAHFHAHRIVDPAEILMVGDTPETDVRGARLTGMASALVIRTGIMADRIARHGLENCVKGLAPHDYPNYFIERFADGLRASS
ncbi:MAG: TIGR01459 family HAD-type hydrolase [Verrucomicrobia bacterium]|nr:TIGR01459 family HAD-type hydrolase [Verrucomicrobiota bacterium]